MSNQIRQTYTTCRKLGMSAVSSFRLARMGEARHSRIVACVKLDRALAR